MRADDDNPKNEILPNPSPIFGPGGTDLATGESGSDPGTLGGDLGLGDGVAYHHGIEKRGSNQGPVPRPFSTRFHIAIPYQPVAKVVTAFDRPCIPADCVAIGSHTPGMLPPLRLVRRAQERSRCSRDFHHGLICDFQGLPPAVSMGAESCAEYSFGILVTYRRHAGRVVTHSTGSKLTRPMPEEEPAYRAIYSNNSPGRLAQNPYSSGVSKISPCRRTGHACVGSRVCRHSSVVQGQTMASYATDEWRVLLRLVSPEKPPTARTRCGI